MCAPLFCWWVTLQSDGKYVISYASVLESVWNVVEALNGFPDFYIKYPADQNIQKQIAAEFHSASSAGFKNCTGAVDGILIWIQRPSKADADKAKIGVKKLFCGRKKNLVLTAKQYPTNV
jgi:hypothetical protein